MATAAAEALELAAIGTEPWDLALQLLNAEFPNAYFALVNQDFLNDRMNFAISWNIDPALVESYAAYYAYINPYQGRWMALQSGGILNSEAVFPVRNISNTEFYNDWLCKAEARTAGIGLKLEASPTDTIYLPMHCPESYTERYSAACTEILRALRGPLERAIRISGAMEQAGAGIAAKTALCNRHQGPALVLDGAMRVIDTNEEADMLLRKADFIRLRNGKLASRDHRLTERLAHRLADLEASVLSGTARLGWENNAEKWILSLTRLPRGTTRALVAPRPQFLLEMVDLTGAGRTRDLSEFARLFSLTPAELRLAAALADGRTLAEAADAIGITFETARQRLKQLFQKTGTSRQPELCAMLARYPG